jgi:hypothetical protein
MQNPKDNVEKVQLVSLIQFLKDVQDHSITIGLQNVLKKPLISKIFILDTFYKLLLQKRMVPFFKNVLDKLSTRKPLLFRAEYALKSSKLISRSHRISVIGL